MHSLGLGLDLGNSLDGREGQGECIGNHTWVAELSKKSGQLIGYLTTIFHSSYLHTGTGIRKSEIFNQSLRLSFKLQGALSITTHLR